MNQNTKNEFVITENAEQTQELGKQFVENLQKGGNVFLYGDLGSGKTTFMQGFAKGLGIKTRIISPTFIIVRKYALSSQKNFYHIDLYRVESQKDMDSVGIAEIISSNDNIVAIEWAERLPKMPKKRWEIHLEMLSENKRKIEIKEYGE